MSSVRWRDWIGKATERSSETTQREVDGTMWRAPERERGSGVMSWVRRRRAEEEGRVSSAGREEDGARTAHQEKGHESTAGEGTREQSRRRDTRAKQEKTTAHAQTEHDKQKREP